MTIWTVQSPQLNTEYIPPNGFWVIPANGGSMTMQWDALNANGTHAATVNVTLINRDITTGVDTSTLALVGVNTGSYSPSAGHDGTSIFAGAFKITSAPSGLPDHCTMQITSSSGVPYPMENLRRTGAWSGVDGSIYSIRRSGVWVMIQEQLIRRSGAWKDT